MPKFICKNPECLFFDKETVEGKTTFKVIDGELKAIERFCPSCNAEREEVIEPITYKASYDFVGLNSNRRNWSKVPDDRKIRSFISK